MATRTREHFQSLAEKRVNKAIKALRLVGNLSNRRNYTYEKEDAQKIIKALKAEMTNLEQRFKDGSTENQEFKF